jgi:acetyltransferase
MGIKAAASHTGSLAVKDDMLDAACKQAGIIRVNDFDELFDVAKALVFQPLPKGNRVGIASMTGGGGVVAVDACVRYGLEIAKLSDETLSRIRASVPSWARIENFIDVEPLFEKVGFDCYDLALEALLNDENVDCVLLVLIPLSVIPVRVWELGKRFSERMRKHPDKTIFVHLIGSKTAIDEAKDELESVGIPVYPSVDRCAWVLCILNEYRNFLNKAIRNSA